ncbi:cell wall metabolism sensor histidine kinase WalK [Kribbella sp. VKM Ac-2566]|uniref:sensor histidine kinase n=1 Tax=Kribbella sp. VKM Ac-2566 TaxID=2512218 RepID=UPI0010E68D12|nr:HAMP domain-containing sensor histidine kinase [Kribbella sp. VKM Ac-2566]TDW81016.1 two-component system sensor histidine kinase MprB [Kribbella sp. VKM Ac-2566]
MSEQRPEQFPSYADRPQQPQQQPQPPTQSRPPVASSNGNRVAATAARTQTWWNETLHKLTLHARVTLLAAVAVGLAVAIVSIAAYVTVRQQMYQNLDNSLTQRAAQAAKKGVLTDLTILQGVPSDALGLSDIRVGVISAEGQQFGPPNSLLPPMGQDELQVARAQGNEVSLRTVGVRNVGSHFRVVAVSASYCPQGLSQACRAEPENYLQPGALVVGQSLGPIDQTLHNLGIVLWAFGLIGVIGAALAGNAVARSGLRPLARLTGAAEHVARTEDLKPIPVTGTDEISRLAMAFNAMLGALAQSRDRQRRLVGDAGHELRTPLTSVRTNLDLLAQADKRGGLRPEDRQQLLDDVRAQMDELTQLIGDLTELARDTPQVRNAELIELSNLVEDAVIKVRRRAPGLEWHVQLTPFPVWGDERLLGRAVTNLLDNAAKYSVPEGTEQRSDGQPVGHVTVRLLDGVLTVTDSGPGIAEADLPHVFDRFYRSSEARSRPGSGLGLAIVKHAAEQHGGMIYARNVPGAGAQFTLWLPHAATQTR